MFSRIASYTPDLPQQKVRQAIYDGFKVWSDVTDLVFIETPGGNADIIIKFAAGYHKDGYPFDGAGKRIFECLWIYFGIIINIKLKLTILSSVGIFVSCLGNICGKLPK